MSVEVPTAVPAPFGDIHGAAIVRSTTARPVVGVLRENADAIDGFNRAVAMDVIDAGDDAEPVRADQNVDGTDHIPRRALLDAA